jgi:hypothetical protein
MNEEPKKFQAIELLTLTHVWHYLNSIKEQAVQILPEEYWCYVKQECDDLFRQASGKKNDICPAWWIGAL